jgi:hypothetical protein
MDETPARQRLSRERLLARLPDPGQPGRSVYVPPGGSLPAGLGDDPAGPLISASETGGVVFLRMADAMVVLPPFPVEHTVAYERIETAPLIELLERRPTVAVFLLRRGGYTMGVFRGEALIDSKTDRRFVKNRHRKGGQSQRRFDRIREKQVHELYGKACNDLRETLAAYEGEIQHVFLGGDRQALIAFRKECAYLDRTFEGRIMARRLPVASDPRRASLDGLPREIWSSDVYVVDPA